MLAEVYQAMGQKEKALETYNRILEIDPDNPFIHLSLADYYRSNGEKEKSVVELKKAFNNPELGIETKISILSSYYALIELHPELREQAMEMTELLVKTHPERSRAFAVRGDFLIQEKKYEEARVAYRKAQELGSKEFTVISQILFLDSQLQDWDAMIRDSEEAMNLFPDQPLVYFFNGIANSQKKQFAKAVVSLNAGVKLVVDNKELESNFYASLGDAYQELKDFARSDEKLRQGAGDRSEERQRAEQLRLLLVRPRRAASKRRSRCRSFRTSSNPTRLPTKTPTAGSCSASAGTTTPKNGSASR